MARNPGTTDTACAYAYASPIGVFEIVSNGSAITRIVLRGRANTRARTASVPVLLQCAEELDEYFQGTRTSFSVRSSLGACSVFARSVLECLRAVPYGSAITYGDLAARAGHSRAARAVGTVMSRNPLPLIYPCHRVVAAGGKVGGFGMGREIKRRLLRLEGNRELFT